MFVSVLKMLYRVCKYNAGYLLRSRNSVYMDRHIYDFSIHFERYRLDARANRLVRFVKFIPRPNLLIIATGKARLFTGAIRRIQWKTYVCYSVATIVSIC